MWEKRSKNETLVHFSFFFFSYNTTIPFTTNMEIKARKGDGSSKSERVSDDLQVVCWCPGLLSP